MDQINLSRVKSIYIFSIFSLLLVLLSLTGILYLYFGSTDSTNYLKDSNLILNEIIWNPSQAGMILEYANTTNFWILIASYVVAFLGFAFVPTITAIRAAKISEIKGYSRTAIFTTPAVLIWLVLFPIVWLISIIMLIVKSASYIKNGVKENKEEINENKKEIPAEPKREELRKEEPINADYRDRYDDRRDDRRYDYYQSERDRDYRRDDRYYRDDLYRERDRRI